MLAVQERQERAYSPIVSKKVHFVVKDFCVNAAYIPQGLGQSEQPILQPGYS